MNNGLFKVYCLEFSIGMGPSIVSKKFKKDEARQKTGFCLQNINTQKSKKMPFFVQFVIK